MGSESQLHATCYRCACVPVGSIDDGAGGEIPFCPRHAPLAWSITELRAQLLDLAHAFIGATWCAWRGHTYNPNTPHTIHHLGNNHDGNTTIALERRCIYCSTPDHTIEVDLA